MRRVPYRWHCAVSARGNRTLERLTAPVTAGRDGADGLIVAGTGPQRAVNGAVDRPKGCGLVSLGSVPALVPASVNGYSSFICPENKHL